LVNRHPADMLSLVAGLIALAFGLVLLTGGIGDLPIEWVAPSVAIGIGLVILIAARPTREPEEDAPAPGDES
jgi:divalent metal cation (Fe/Co/Zn/Cd) transporter